jgi:phosphoribosylformimino-5-aminoimidazole carboxamide ribotide isomerase
MGSFQIIPAIDLIDGKCVRLSQGDYAQKKVYNERPLEVALQFQDAGIRRLHLVDLDGAKAGRVQNWKVLELLATQTNLEIDFGGGVKSKEDAQGVLNAGAALVTIGSLAVKRREYFLNLVAELGAEKFFIGADVKQEKLAVHGWLEQTDVLVYDFLNAPDTGPMPRRAAHSQRWCEPAGRFARTGSSRLQRRHRRKGYLRGQHSPQ